MALALGAPWGAYAMGGAFPGVYPAPMRAAALAQIPVYGLLAGVVCVRAGLALPRLRALSRVLIWAVVGVGALSVALNLITPSPLERLIWTPVAAVLFAASLR